MTDSPPAASPTAPPAGDVAAAIDPAFLELLVCPQTRTKLELREGWLFNSSPETPLKYPIRGGIPQLLADEAVAVEG